MIPLLQLALSALCQSVPAFRHLDECDSRTLSGPEIEISPLPAIIQAKSTAHKGT